MCKFWSQKKVVKPTRAKPAKKRAQVDQAHKQRQEVDKRLSSYKILVGCMVSLLRKMIEPTHVDGGPHQNWTLMAWAPTRYMHQT